METFVQHQLMHLIQRKYNRLNLILERSELTHFFSIYEEDPIKFKFTEYEVHLIQKIVNFVNDTIKREGVEYFVKEEDEQQISWSKKWYFQNEIIQENHALKEFPTFTHLILHKLLETADQNASRQPGGYRYDDELKGWASYLRSIGGPSLYDTLQKNMPLALPSLTTTNRFMARPNHSIVEGVLRCDELLVYLTERQQPLALCLSEDATRVINRVQFDVKTNQLVGFVPPLDDNGLPVPFTFSARTAEEIAEHFLSGNSIAKYINVIMAKPLGGAPSFCLLIFGSNSKYTTLDVLNRWTHITSELKKRKIEVLTIASDSDTKYNAAMKKESCLGRITTIFSNIEWFSCGNNLNSPFFNQDPPHILTKLRNWFLKSKGHPKKFPFGSKFYIKADDLVKLMENVGKDKHRLTKTVLNPVDRQNYESAKRMCDQRVIDLLHKYVKGSDGTAKFLEIAQNFITAYEDSPLTPTDRIKKLWYSIFMVRLWRQYIVKANGMTLKDNFLTSNCYTCLELNVHTLVLIILHLRKTKQPHLFQPIKYSSQPCESFFRQIRSISTVYSTVVNCSTKEMLNRAKKIQLQNNISASNSTFKFPKKIFDTNKSVALSLEELPIAEEIIEIIESCKKKAIDDALKIGLLKKRIVDIPCPLTEYKSTLELQKKFNDMNLSVNNKREETINFDFENIELKNYASKFHNKKISETSSYVEVLSRHGKKIYWKPELCWFFSKEPDKLSSDRVQRFRNIYDNEKSKLTTNRLLKLRQKYYKQRKKTQIRNLKY